MPDVLTFPRGSIVRARAQAVYPTLNPGSVSLVLSDGPYALGKAGWDSMRLDELPEWYRPHVEAWGHVCAEDATVYVWGTDDSASILRPLMARYGWTRRVRITWDKKTGAGAIFNHGTWGDVTEVADVYTRGRPVFNRPRYSGNVWGLLAAGTASPLSKERLRTGRIGTSMNGRTQWAEPTHPCQKPLAFYDRMIRASSNPGDLVMEPFGGTCRAAVACEWMPEAEARSYVVAEPDEDGRDYIGGATSQIREVIRQRERRR